MPLPPRTKRATGAPKAIGRRAPVLVALCLSVLVSILLTGCLPATLEDGRPDAAVIGAPANGAAPGAAAALDVALRATDTGHDLVSAARTRFLETRSGLVGSQVVPGAARIARSSSADVAVVVQPASLSRELLGPDEHRYERLVLQLDVHLIDAATAQELGRLSGPRYVGEASRPDGVLPPLDQDPLLQAAVREGIDDLAPRVARELHSLATTGSSVE